MRHSGIPNNAPSKNDEIARIVDADALVSRPDMTLADKVRWLEMVRHLFDAATAPWTHLAHRPRSTARPAKRSMPRFANWFEILTRPINSAAITRPVASTA